MHLRGAADQQHAQLTRSNVDLMRFPRHFFGQTSCPAGSPLVEACVALVRAGWLLSASRKLRAQRDPWRNQALWSPEYISKAYAAPQPRAAAHDCSSHTLNKGRPCTLRIKRCMIEKRMEQTASDLVQASEQGREKCAPSGRSGRYAPRPCAAPQVCRQHARFSSRLGSLFLCL